MTTTDMPSLTPPPPSPGSAAPERLLRRSRDGRVGAGVAAGLGRYFGFDPVLFRVLFATAAFFGGAGIIAYVLAWIAIPEEGTQHAPIDGWIAGLRRRRVPVWVVAVGAGLLFWALAFSWWTPGPPFLPALAVVVLLILAFARRGWDDAPPPASTVPPTAPEHEAAADDSSPTTPVSLTKTAPVSPATEPPPWVRDTRAWIDESRVARISRRRRAMPVRVGVVIALITAVAVLAAIDAISGIPLPVYFWVTLGIVGAGLLVGFALRRTPWSLVALLVPAVLGLAAFGNTSASLHDGVGQRVWQPQKLPAADYRLAFGQGTLDLSKLSPLTARHTTVVTMAAGHVRIIAPPRLNLAVSANARFGDVAVNANDLVTGGGYETHRYIAPPPKPQGARLTVVVHLADGMISVNRR